MSARPGAASSTGARAAGGHGRVDEAPQPRHLRLRRRATRVHLPGSTYSNVPPALLRGFAVAAVDSKIYVDEWGAFMSGYAPLQHGAGEYLVGIDMRAAEVRRKFQQLRVIGLVSLGMSLILALVFSRVLARHFMRPIGALIGHCRAIAGNQLDERITMRTGDDLDNLMDAFNAMTANLAATRSGGKRTAQRQSTTAKEIARLVPGLHAPVIPRPAAGISAAPARTTLPIVIPPARRGRRRPHRAAPSMLRRPALRLRLPL